MSKVPFGSFGGMGIYGAGYGFCASPSFIVADNIFNYSPIVPADIFAPGLSLYGNVWKAGCSIGNMVGSWPPGFFCGRYGAVSTYMDWLYGRIQARKRPSKANQRTPLPQGTDSPSYAERGRAYAREMLGLGKKLPEHSKIARNIYGATPKDEEAKAKYKENIEEDRKNDQILRAITENIAGDWIKDPKAAGQASRRWNIARSQGDHELAVRALLDPFGDGRYLNELARIIPGISDKDDAETMWRKIAEHLNNTVGLQAIFAMGDEVMKIAGSKGIAGETPIANKEEYISKLVDKGYEREEALTIVAPLSSKEEADELVNSLDKQESTANYKELKERLNTGKADEKKQAEQNIAFLEKERAEKYLQGFMRFARWRDGKSKTDSFGYKAGELPQDVSDVPTAVKWAYGNLGISVDVPKKEKKDSARASTSSTANPSPLQKVTKGLTKQGFTQAAEAEVANRVNKASLLNGTSETLYFNHKGKQARVTYVFNIGQTVVEKTEIRDPATNKWVDVTKWAGY